MNSNSLTDEYGYYWELLNHIFDDFAKKNGMNYTQLSVLYTIYRQPGCTQKTICERNFLPKQTVNTAIINYIHENILTYKINDQDKRQKNLYLTKEGQAYVDQFFPKLVNSRYKAMELLPKEDQILLVELTKKYILKIQEIVEKDN